MSENNHVPHFHKLLGLQKKFYDKQAYIIRKSLHIVTVYIGYAQEVNM